MGVGKSAPSAPPFDAAAAILTSVAVSAAHGPTGAPPAAPGEVDLADAQRKKLGAHIHAYTEQLNNATAARDAAVDDASITDAQYQAMEARVGELQGTIQLFENQRAGLRASETASTITGVTLGTLQVRAAVAAKTTKLVDKANMGPASIKKLEDDEAKLEALTSGLVKAAAGVRSSRGVGIPLSSAATSVASAQIRSSRERRSLVLRGGVLPVPPPFQPAHVVDALAAAAAATPATPAPLSATPRARQPAPPPVVPQSTDWQ